MPDMIKSKDGLEIARDNYVEYSKYVITSRAYPSTVDGCKMVHRRIIYAASNLPRHTVKSSTLTGETVKYHPHPQSIYGSVVLMANKYDCPFPLFDTQGNFGGLGEPPSAERYTGLALSDISRKIFTENVQYAEFIQGEIDDDEPKYLPAMLPLSLLHGSYGIPSGMSTVDSPPLNPIDLIKYYIAVLKSGNLDEIPNVLVRPNLGDCSIVSSKKDWKALLQTGEGRAVYAPHMRVINNKTIEVTGCHPDRGFAHITKALNEEIIRDQVDVRNDTTTSYKYTIEIAPYRKVNINDVQKKLTKALTVNKKYRFIFCEDDNAIFCGIHYVVKRNLEYLMECLQRKFKIETEKITERLISLDTIEKMKKDGTIAKLHKLDEERARQLLVKQYGISYEQAKAVFMKPMSYMTREHEKEIKELRDQIEENNKNSNDIYGYLIKQYKDLLSDIQKMFKDKPMTDFE